MPIPLGIWATAGAGGAAAPAFELIATGTVSPYDTITFSSIPSTYKHLQIRFTMKDSSSNTNRDAGIRFNGDTGANYASHRLFGDGSVQSTALTGASYMRFRIPGNGFADVYSGGVLDILDYGNASKNTTMKLLSGYAAGNGNSEVGLYSGAWFNTAPITSISLFTFNFNSIMSGSRFSLYGIKG